MYIYKFRIITTNVLKGFQVLRFIMQNNNDKNVGSGTDTISATRTIEKIKKPSLYRVILLNDDYTPMEFVVLILERFFQKDRDTAMHIMLHVHHQGHGECGIYTFEVAETKVGQVMECAKQNQHPLICIMEKQ
jgi:ATP-dependent Clp protease adaptor protein ClpS